VLSPGLARFPQIHGLTLLPIILGLVVGMMFLTIRGKINETLKTSDPKNLAVFGTSAGGALVLEGVDRS
jgi:hypothetical protein